MSLDLFQITYSLSFTTLYEYQTRQSVCRLTFLEGLALSALCQEDVASECISLSERRFHPAGDRASGCG
jgi:hypothetical protein